MAKRLEQCRSGSDFVKYAERRGADTRRGKGSHVIVSTDRGQTVVPCHPGDLATGTRFAIVKAFIAMGLGVLILYALGVDVLSIIGRVLTGA